MGTIRVRRPNLLADRLNPDTSNQYLHPLWDERLRSLYFISRRSHCTVLPIHVLRRRSWDSICTSYNVPRVDLDQLISPLLRCGIDHMGRTRVLSPISTMPGIDCPCGIFMDGIRRSVHIACDQSGFRSDDPVVQLAVSWAVRSKVERIHGKAVNPISRVSRGYRPYLSVVPSVSCFPICTLILYS